MSELARLPKVDRVAGDPRLDRARQRLGAKGITGLARRAIDEARRDVREGRACPSFDAVVDRVVCLADASLSSRARRVINATGVVLHTNLGRAPLADRAVRALAESAGGYTSIEVDLATGRRGARGAFAESALASLTGAESALVVNNNAAAVLLLLSAVAAGKSVVVSRAELVEIGGGFRVPDVLARSGAKLVEVGTTNKTRIEDYARAIDQAGDVAAILRVHQGNFRQIGFVERPSLASLVECARAKGVAILEDLGGGALIDLAKGGVVGEPVVGASIAAGVDVVAFSTDKVLGGPQGGALVGRRDLVDRARVDPLARALRLGRLPLVALEATLACYLEGAHDEVPSLRALRASTDDVRSRATKWKSILEARGVACAVVDLPSMAGGGSFAEAPIESAGLALDVADPDAISDRLRDGAPPIFARIHEGRLLFDARTVLPDEDDALVDGIARATASSRP